MIIGKDGINRGIVDYERVGSYCSHESNGMIVRDILKNGNEFRGHYLGVSNNIKEMGIFRNVVVTVNGRTIENEVF